MLVKPYSFTYIHTPPQKKFDKNNQKKNPKGGNASSLLIVHTQAARITRLPKCLKENDFKYTTDIILK